LYHTLYWQSSTAKAQQNPRIQELKLQIEAATQQGNKSATAEALNKLALIYWQNIEYNKAIESFNESLKINTEIGNKNAIQQINNFLATIYFEDNNSAKALEYYQRSYEMIRKTGDKSRITAELVNIASVLQSLQKYKEAHEKLLQALDLAKELNDIKLLRNCYGLLAENAKKMNNADLSVEYYNLFLSFDKYLNAQQLKQYESKVSNAEIEKRATESQLNLTESQLNMKEDLLKAAHDSLFKAKEISSEQQLQIELLKQKEELNALRIKQNEVRFKHERTIRNILLVGVVIVILFSVALYRQFRAKKKFNELLQLQNEDILHQNIEIEKQAGKLSLQNTELEKLSIVASNTDNAVMIFNKQLQLEWVNEAFNRLWGYTINEFNLLDGHHLTAIHEIYADQKFKNIENNKKSISKTDQFSNKEGDKVWVQSTITPVFDTNTNLDKIIVVESDISKIKEAELAILQSIQYAARIQKAILPQDDYVKSLLADSFVFYRPRDIVSGDFYWMAERKQKIIVVVADCTGHGVPGAFLSMLGITYLNEITTNISPLQANEILNQLRMYFIKSLRQSDEAQPKDGMDITLSIIDRKYNTIQIAGAYNSVYIVRHQDTELTSPPKDHFTVPKSLGVTKHNDLQLIEVKGDKMPIGVHRRSNQSFTNFEAYFHPDDTIYMFTDGYTDQFNENLDTKFSSRQFKSLLLEIHNKSLAEQSEILDEKLLQWRKNSPQIDDVLVLGFCPKFELLQHKAPQRYDWQNKTILVAEDTDINYDLLEATLLMTGAIVLRATNGQEAVDICSANQAIELILMDVRLPILDGYSATTLIRKFRPNIPIIAQTAFALPGEEEKALEAGCSSFITKPFSPSQILLKISEYL